MSSTLPADLDLLAGIQQLRVERKAIILAHYYQEAAIQDLADVVGDSLQLARAARDMDAEVILFAGVHFMAEVASIYNPGRIVLVPDLDAGCSLADAAPAADVLAWKAAHPDHQVVAYINCTAATKAAADIICTSSNAVKVVESMPTDRPILFLPDRNLGAWVQSQSGRQDISLWDGACEVHETFSLPALRDLKARHPHAQVIAHPECEPPILAEADHIGSTASLLSFITDKGEATFIVATEPGIVHQMVRANPQATFIPLPATCDADALPGRCDANECRYMRMNTLEKIYLALRDLQPRVTVDEETRVRALAPLDRMLAL